VFRLLYRFYNTLSGSIQVDGHDVEDLIFDSVRRDIGVVPQDNVLFKETLVYNLRYANPDATDEQLYEVCRAASMHDEILTFLDNYETKVGERGLRLSGGEKQRVAIARTILKNPRIIMLDEATTALDTKTEQDVQCSSLFIDSVLLPMLTRSLSCIKEDSQNEVHMSSSSRRTVTTQLCGRSKTAPSKQLTRPRYSRTRLTVSVASPKTATFFSVMEVGAILPHLLTTKETRRPRLECGVAPTA
jgi:ABC-type polar amino acid transport system ATPase subunit